LKIIDRRFEVMARKVAIWFFGALWMVSWSWMDDLAATGVWVRHDGYWGSSWIIGRKRIDVVKFSFALLVRRKWLLG
jgi:hypothetical protein